MLLEIELKTITTLRHGAHYRTTSHIEAPDVYRSNAMHSFD